MADDDKDLWDSAKEEPVADVQQEPQQTEETAEVKAERGRDERGRFAAKATTEAVEADQTATQQPPESKETSHGIPPWRLKEEADARRAAEERAAQRDREVEDLRRQMAAFEKQNEPQPKVPDIYEDPAAFVDYHNREAINPVKSEISELREFYSQRDAVREHGAEKVKAAYAALDQAGRSGDREALAAIERIKQSMHPYGDIVDWHAKQTVLSTIGTDPEAYVERRLQEKLKDPAYQAKLMDAIRGQAKARPSTTSLPPSLNKATASNPLDDDAGDDGEAGLLRQALSR